MIKTHLIVDHVTELTPERLQEMGIQGLILDLDNTLMPPRSGTLDDAICQWLTNLKEKGINCICVTNNKNQAYCLAAECTLGMPLIYHARKPFLTKLRQAVKQLDLQPHQVGIVGDRPLTDLLGGYRLGMKTILVEPLTKLTESRMIQFLRRLERLFVSI